MVKRKKISLIEMSDVLTICAVTKLKQNLEREINASSDIEIDFSRIDKVDTAGFQLIMYLKKKYIKEGKKISFINTGENIRNICSFYNELGMLGDEDGK